MIQTPWMSKCILGLRMSVQIVSDPLDIHVFCAGPPGYPCIFCWTPWISSLLNFPNPLDIQRILNPLDVRYPQQGGNGLFLERPITALITFDNLGVELSMLVKFDILKGKEYKICCLTLILMKDEIKQNIYIVCCFVTLKNLNYY